MEKDDDDFLRQASGIKITDEDIQEGYSADLLRVKPRTASRKREEVPLTSQERARSPTDGEKGTSFGGEKMVEARPKPEPATGAATKRRSTHGDRKKRRKKKKKLAWYQSRLFFIVLALLLLGVGLGVGLGIGLTSGSDSPSSDSSENTTTDAATPVASISISAPADPTPEISRGGESVSVQGIPLDGTGESEATPRASEESAQITAGGGGQELARWRGRWR